MVKKIKEQNNSKYSTIIATKDSIHRISLARDAWKVEQRNFSQVGIMPFMLYLLDFYEINKDKINKHETKI